MSGAMPTVFVVDDEPPVLKALWRLVRAEGLNVATFASSQEFLGRHDPNLPGCLLLDIAMPGLNGLELQEALAAKGSTLPIIFLTGHGDIPMSVQAMKHGALDFLTKPVDDSVLIQAIRDAIEKDRVMRSIHERLATLTARERQVLRLVVAGKLNKQIAVELGTVEKTIKVHRGHVMEKMKVRSLAELVRLAERAGIT